MNELTIYDYGLLIIGGGPAGYHAGRLANDAGLRTAVVERAFLGGTCLIKGCIPSKQELDEMRKIREARAQRKRGIVSFDAYEFHRDILVSKVSDTVEILSKSIEATILNGVEIIEGTARFADPHTLAVVADEGSETSGAPRRVSAQYILVATGATPFIPPIDGLVVDGERIITSEEALYLSSVPQTFGIIGAGPIGLEIATIFSEAGSKVTVWESRQHILPPGTDLDVRDTLANILEKSGIELHLGCAIQRVESGENCVRIFVKGNDKPFEVEALLVATGIIPNIESLRLEQAGVESGKRGIIVDPLSYRTNIPHIFAVGDAADLPFKLAHTASAEAERVVAQLAGHPLKLLNYRLVPSCIYTHPPAAMFGMSKEQAESEGHRNVREVTCPYRYLGKPIALGNTEGFVKIVLSEYGEILGAHIVGKNAESLIHFLVLAAATEQTPQSILESMVFAHPEEIEVVGEALRLAVGRSVHSPARQRA